MPQIQIIPPVPGFGSQLGEALGGGIGQGFSQGISSKLSSYLAQKEQEKKTNQLLSALGISSQPSPSAELEGQQTRTPSLKNLSQEQLLAASIMNPALAPALSSIYKNQQKETQEAQTKQTGQESLNRMAELIPEVGFGSKIKSKALGGKTAEAVGEFESLSGALEALLVDKVSRGTLSNARFKYITETLLPKPTDREATIRGKLKALSKELNLELPPAFSQDNVLKKAKPGTKLTDEVAGEIFKKSGNDPDKARKLAKQLGYEFQ